MGIFGKLSSWLKQAPQAGGEAGFITFKVKCEKCGEEITIKVNQRTDLQNLYLESGEQGAAFNLKKEILGKKCSNLMQINVDFDRNYHIIAKEVSGGSFLPIKE